jgi:hypothetical protein
MKRAALAVLPLLCLAPLAHSQAPAGWKVIKDPKGGCQMSVPAEWKQQDILGTKLSAADSPDNTLDAVVNTMEGTDWATFKSLVFQIYTKDKDRPKIEDGPKRLWFEITTMPVAGKTAWYVAVPAKGSTCNAQINFKKGDKKAEEIARKVVETIRG